MSAAMRQMMGAAKETVVWMRGIFRICIWDVIINVVEGKAVETYGRDFHDN